MRVLDFILEGIEKKIYNGAGDIIL